VNRPEAALQKIKRDQLWDVETHMLGPDPPYCCCGTDVSGQREPHGQAVHISQNRDAPAIVLRRVPFALVVFCCSMRVGETVRKSFLEWVRQPSGFHSSSASQYFISKYSISLLATEARSRHMLLTV